MNQAVTISPNDGDIYAKGVSERPADFAGYSSGQLSPASVSYLNLPIA
jgi:hypothetical protein